MSWIRYPSGFNHKDIVSWGTSGLVCLDRSTQTVVKFAHSDGNKEALAVEQRIYERFSDRGGHAGLLRYYKSSQSAIRLELASNFGLRSYLKKNASTIEHEQRIRWAEQIASALHFVHSAKVIHGDLTCNNIFLDEHLNAKLADFSGSSLDGSPLLIAVTPSHRCPGPALSTQGDIFALGSALYEIMTGAAPYHDLSESDIRSRYADGQFPETVALGPIGHIVTKCWQGQYSNAGVIEADIQSKRVLAVVV